MLRASRINTKKDSFSTKTTWHYVYHITPDSWPNMVEMLGRRGTFKIDVAIAALTEIKSPIWDADRPPHRRVVGPCRPMKSGGKN